MNRNILYLTPYPPVQSSIGDYAVAYKSAVERFSDWRMTVGHPFEQQARFTPADLLRLRRTALRQKAEGYFDDFALAHVELAIWQYYDFWRLYWLQRRVPSLRCCVTLHDPPVVVAPALAWLSMGSRLTLVRRALRLLDFTPLGRGVVRSVLRKAAQVVVLSQRGAAALRGRFGPGLRLQVLPLLNYTHERPPPRPARADGHPLTVIFFGRWGPSKGLDLLVRATERLAAAGAPPFRLLLTGSPTPDGVCQRYGAAVHKLIARSPARDIIETPGYIPPPEVDRLLLTADVLVLPYLKASRIAASSVLVRGMTAGLAIAACDTDAVAEDIVNEQTGLLVPPGNEHALADALGRLLKDRTLRETLGRRAQEHAFNEHGWPAVAARASSVYTTALET